MAQANKEEVTLLVLGDGDFSYCLDWATYLANSIIYRNKDEVLHLIATGLDSQQVLHTKYKDSNFLVTKLKAIRAPHLKVSVYHGINAIHNAHDERPQSLPPARHVVFNHPHLATESCQLHSQFLHHLFHSVATVWMEKEQGAYFHLTLAKGQYGRWSCQKAAEEHGFVLVHQSPFRSPQATSSRKPYYQHRRHQSGKSFKSRTPQGSISYTFTRKTQLVDVVTDTTGIATHVQMLLNLQHTVADPIRTFPCPHCGKEFREERSRKGHVKAVHDGEEGKKRKRNEAAQVFLCKLCPLDNGEYRQFPTAQALQNHQIAKHSGAHKEIKPDWWYKTTTFANTSAKPNSAPTAEARKFVGFCAICGLSFATEKQREEHHWAFLPSDALTPPDDKELQLHYLCQYCSKNFRDQRAQKQHENFCSSRPVSKD